jgi:PQQ-dependent dehydrogenase (s-GDH family)
MEGRTGMKRTSAVLAGMQVLVLAASVAWGGSAVGSSSSEHQPEFTAHVLATGLGDPYEIVWGPDGYIWATEKSGLKVTRVDPATGAKFTALSLPQAVHTPDGEDGVLGLALHPDLLQHRGHDYVYISYTYRTTTPAPITGETRRTKIVRYTFDTGTGQLRSPVDLITDLPGGTQHQSARLRIGPDGKLYYTIGDQGANQLENFCNPNWAQRLPTAGEVRAGDWTAYQGKILRLDVDGSIPADNPVLNLVRSHVWTYGHRNAQGLTFGPNGTLYEGEQGPKTDDEINIIQMGGNYGWPHVAGYRDDRAYTYDNWSASAPTPCEQLTFSDLQVPPSVPRQPETEWGGSFLDPIHTFGTVGDDFDFADPACAAGGLYFICWPTLADSSLEYYQAENGPGIPGWNRSLIMTTLKDGTVYRLTLTYGGTRLGEVIPLWKSQDRYRDTAFSPDGTTIYAATDSAGLVRDADGAPTSDLENPGSILVLRRNG